MASGDAAPDLDSSQTGAAVGWACAQVSPLTAFGAGKAASGSTSVRLVVSIRLSPIVTPIGRAYTGPTGGESVAIAGVGVRRGPCWTRFASASRADGCC